MSRGALPYKVLQSAVDDLRLHKLARFSHPSTYPPVEDEFLYARVDTSPALKRRADAEWDAMDERGQLPDDWEYRP